ncbi:MAG: hypothetical protein L0177_07345 [Chloroflexi bacterium]|nr:hypothetical protein [Chloroflexota bacterium]
MKRPIVITILFAAALLAVALACTSAPPASSPTVTPTPGQTESIEVSAPIEEVRIELPDAGSTQGTMVVVSGLPDSCHTFKRYEISRSGDSFVVQIINSKATTIGGEPVACAQVYGTVETEIPLEGEIAACEVYDVTVNGQRRAVQAIAPNARCETPHVVVPAPIDEVTINVAESFPPQYIVHIVSGLPNGCARFNELTTARDGSTITITITNLMPADPNVACTMIYGIMEHNVNLGRDFTPGETYTVKVNDMTKTFVAQGEGQANAQLGEAFELGFGKTAIVLPDGLVIEFVEALEDSRCPANAICIWQGQARILVDVTLDGMSLGRHELLLEAGIENPAGVEIGDYVVKFVALNPYPGTTGNEQIEKREYVATLIVAKAGAETPEVVKANLGEEFDLRFGQTAVITPPGLQVRFVDVVEDSRCPINAVCVHAGRARILVNVTFSGVSLGYHELELDTNAGESTTKTIGNFLVRFVALDPQPLVDVRIDKADYTATLVVTARPVGELEGGVLATFDVEGEQFKVWVTNPDTIEQVLALQSGAAVGFPNGTLRAGPGEGNHNAPWSWHLDPEATEIVELSIELCDGMPSFIENDLGYWLETVGRYCPWAATLTDVQDLR